MRLQHRLHKLIALRELETGERMNISQVADESGVSRQTIYFWMNNKRMDRIDVPTVEKLCAYFGVGIGDLFELVND